MSEPKIKKGSKVALINGWSLDYWFVVFSISFGTADMGEYKIHFQLIVLGLGFEVRE
jgi:hypothetical protein